MLTQRMPTQISNKRVHAVNVYRSESVFLASLMQMSLLSYAIVDCMVFMMFVVASGRQNEFIPSINGVDLNT